jgi:hypothetical protein
MRHIYVSFFFDYMYFSFYMQCIEFKIVKHFEIGGDGVT